MEEISFKSTKDNITIHGTFSSGIGKNKGAVLLITGSGKVDRDETTPATLTYSGKEEKLFVQLSDTLNRAGFTTFRYDKRGVLDANGNVDIEIWKTADREHLISDAIDAAKALLNKSKITTDQLIILGHSEGSIIATEVAINLGKKVKALLLFGAQARSMKDMLHYQIVESRKKQSSGVDQAESPEKEYLKAVTMIENSTEDFAPDGKPMKWYHQHLAAPANAERLALVDAKIFIFQGIADPQTPIEEIDRFIAAGVKNIISYKYPGLGHGFSPDKEGRPTLGPIDEKVLSDLIDVANNYL